MKRKPLPFISILIITAFSFGAYTPVEQSSKPAQAKYTSTDEVLNINLKPEDIFEVRSPTPQVMYIQLGTEKTNVLKDITNANIGKTLEISLEDTLLVKAKIQVTMNLGSIAVSNPSQPLMTLLKDKIVSSDNEPNELNVKD